MASLNRTAVPLTWEPSRDQGEVKMVQGQKIPFTRVRAVPERRNLSAEMAYYHRAKIVFVGLGKLGWLG